MASVASRWPNSYGACAALAATKMAEPVSGRSSAWCPGQRMSFSDPLVQGDVGSSTNRSSLFWALSRLKSRSSVAFAWASHWILRYAGSTRRRLVCDVVPTVPSHQGWRLLPRRSAQCGAS